MDFGAFPPEINSARMYAGPGSAPMLAAASAWNGLAAELRSAAAAYQSAITGLTSQGWSGPASAAMATAAVPYITWMKTTAEQAEQAAIQARAAAAAYEAAFAMTVPPPVIAANRAQQAALVATNFLGQNTPAIAATEAHYGQMWGQDTAAMYGYAADSAVATRLLPFTAPRQTVNPAGQANQDSAVAQSAGTSAASGTQSTLSQAMSGTPHALQGLASPVQSTGPGSDLSGIFDALGMSDPTDTISNGLTNLMSSSVGPMGLGGIGEFGAGIAIMRGAAMAAADPLGLGALEMAGEMPGAGIGMLTSSSGAAGLAGSPGLGGSSGVLASASRAMPVGGLSVPQSWAAAMPSAAPPPAATGSLVSSWAAAPAAGAGGTPGVPGMPVPGSGSGRGLGFAAPRYGFKPVVMGRPVAAG